MYKIFQFIEEPINNLFRIHFDDIRRYLHIILTGCICIVVYIYRIFGQTLNHIIMGIISYYYYY